MSATPLPSRAQTLRYGLLGLPLAFVALPLYVQLPDHHARSGALPLAWLGLLLLGTRCLDALIDPWLGRWGDRLLQGPPLRQRLALSLLALAVLGGFAGLFFAPELAPLALMAWLALMMMLCQLAYSALAIVHQAWAARQGDGALAQSRWVAAREGWALLGVLLASALPALAGWTWATLALALGLMGGLWAWQRAGDATAARAATPDAPAAFWLPWTQPWFRRLLLVYLCNGLASAVPATLVMFFVQDRLQAAPTQVPLFLGLYFVAAALSLPLWLRVLARVGLARTWWAGMGLSVLAFVGASTLGAGDQLAFALICVATGLALGADLTVPGAWLNQGIAAAGHPAQAATYMGWWQLVTKLNLALAAGLAMPLLAAWGYAPGRQDPAALHALTRAYALLPCGLKLGAALLLRTRLWTFEPLPQRETP